jgi:subtilisin-like proprotein convertase family protein
MKIRKNARYRVIQALIFTAIIVLAVVQIPSFFSSIAHSKKNNSSNAKTAKASTGQASNKEQLIARLKELDDLIKSLKRQIAAVPGNTKVVSQLNAALAESESITAQLGGDRVGFESPAPPRQTGSGGNIVQSPTGAPPNVVPPAPGCVITNSTTTNSTPVAIPSGPAVVTSTIVISGAEPYLWDVDLQTFMTHTFPGDLDVTITSPAGTIVTLTTDNAGTNDDVFNGTVWDDQANAAGQVPYTTNNGMVTDHAYTIGVLASTLTPEEPLSAFRGEDPNGTWTITISDDTAVDAGSLNSWAVLLATLPAAPTETTTSFTQSTPVAIPGGPAVVTSTVVVSGAGASLSKVTLQTFMTHTFPGDLDVTIQSPSGRIVTLTTDNAGSNDDVFNGTLWDDDANPAGQVPYTTNNGMVTDHAYAIGVLASPLTPEEPLGAFAGEDPNGTWTITISDDTAVDGGSLNSWTLNITTGTCCTITCPANITQSNDPNQCGAVVTYPAPTTTGSCGTITCSPASGSFFPVGTTTVTCQSTSGTPSCSFTITINDTQPPTITCPANISTVTAICDGTAAVVSYPPPTASDNCPGVTVACVPPSGSTLPIGVTTVTCTATDAAGNTATCSFTVTTFNACIQDDNNPNIVLLWNTRTGAYRFCCNGNTYTGTGLVQNKGTSHTINHMAPDRRVNGVLDCATSKGQGGLQASAGSLICSVNDRDIRNNTCSCGGAPPPTAASR